MWRGWLEREGAWPWPLLRGNSVKVSADELPPMERKERRPVEVRGEWWGDASANGEDTRPSERPCDWLGP